MSELKCPNKSHADWKLLVNNIGELNAYKVWMANGEEIPSREAIGNIIEDYKSSPEVSFSLKAVELLSSDKAKEVFTKGDKAGWSLDKKLSELQVPKDQKQIILDSGKTNREDIITDLLANYSYTIEVNTSLIQRLKGITQQHYTEFVKAYDNSNLYHAFIDGVHTPIIISKEEYDNKKVSQETFNKTEPSNYYSNLTVPGGTNYTENEIATPAITPSIKGHAQFATDKGIGWFRSDDKGVVLIGGDVDLYNETKATTRRILEMQSDLFQKGRDRRDLTSKKVNTLVTSEPYIKDLDRQEKILGLKDNILEATDGYSYKKQSNNTWLNIGRNNVEKDNENKFLQLLNKDNNWVTFFVKSIIQDSAKKGYEKVLFPSGNTASKIEGHSTLEEFKIRKEKDIERLEIKKEVFNKKNKTWIIIDENQYETDIAFDTEKEAEDFINNKEDDYRYKLNDQAQIAVEIEALDRIINQYKKELERVETEGFGALKPIFNFYENTVTNILKKNFKVKQITDEFGNTWNEVEITPKESDRIFLSDLLSRLKKDLKAPSGKISFLQRNMLLKRLKNYNTVNGTKHSIRFNQVGQSNGFTYEIIENWNGVNPTQQSLFQLESDGSVARDYITQALENLLSKFNITVERMDNVLYKDKSVVALADITNRIVKVAKGLEDKTTLPEEAGHFLLELLGRDNPLYQRIVSLAKTSKKYNDIISSYGDVYNDNEKVAIEAAGQLLGEALRIELALSPENPSFISRFMATVKQAWTVLLKKLTIIPNDELANLIQMFAKGSLESNSDIQKQLSVDNLTSHEKDLNFAQLKIDEIQKAVDKIKSTVIQKNAIHGKKIIKSDSGLTIALMLEQLTAEMANVEGKQLILDFVKFAVEDLKSASTTLQRLIDAGGEVFSVENLEDLYQQVAMYDLLDTIVELETNDPELLEIKKIIYGQLNPIRTSVKSKYRKHGARLLAKKWSIYLKNTPLTDDDLEKALLESMGDIGWGAMMLRSVSDSSDIVSQITAKIIGGRKETVKMGVNRFETALYNAINKYTEATGVTGEKMWDFMFMRDENGKKNGRYIQKPKMYKGTLQYPLNDKFYKKRAELANALLTADNYSDRVSAIRKYIPNSWYATDLERESIVTGTDKEIIRFFVKGARKVGEYQDKSYDNLTTAQKNLHEAYVSMKTELDNMIPNGAKLGNKLPQVRKGFLDSIVNNFEKFKEETLDHLDLKTSANSMTLYKLDGSEAKFVPIHYVGMLSDPETIETDLAGSLISYAKMAINNKLMHEIEYDINMIQNLVAQRDVTQTKSGKVVTSYLEGQTSVPTIKGVQTQQYRQLKEYIEMNLYGETQKEEVANVFGTEVDLGKAANIINAYTAFKSLALNMFSAVSNVTFGRLQRMGEALSGEYFNVKDWGYANKVYFSEMTKDIADMTDRIPKSKMGLFNRNMDFTNSFEEGIRAHKRKFTSNPLVTKALSVSNLFFMNTMGEHMLQMTTALAVARKFKLDNGRIANLYEEATVNPSTRLLEYPSDVTKNDIERFKQVVRGLNQSMDGIYNTEDRAIAQRYAIGRMAFLFRRFMVPSFDKRWKNSSAPVYNLKRGKYEEGMYISFGRFMLKLINEMKAHSWQLSAARNAWNTTEDFRKAGVIKASYEIGSLIVLALILSIAEGELDDDDPKVAFVIYQVNRLYTELGAFFPLTAPQDLFRILKSPAAGVNTVQDVVRLAGDLFHPFETYESGKHAGDTRLFWHTVRMVPIVNQIEKLSNIPEQTKFLKASF